MAAYAQAWQAMYPQSTMPQHPSPAQRDLGPLGPEEVAHHDALVSAAAAARALLAHLGQPQALTASKATEHLQEKQLQDKLAQMRSHIRDLELMGEEQDT